MVYLSAPENPYATHLSESSLSDAFQTVLNNVGLGVWEVTVRPHHYIIILKDSVSLLQNSEKWNGKPRLVRARARHPDEETLRL